MMYALLSVITFHFNVRNNVRLSIRHEVNGWLTLNVSFKYHYNLKG